MNFIPIIAQGLVGAPVDPRFGAIATGAAVLLAVLLVAAAIRTKP